MTGLVTQYPQYLGIGIDESTAIVVQGSVAEVVGKSRVAFFDKANDPVEAKPGQKYNLAKRKLEP
jgi:cyanophycinase-like exopeptidase